MELYMCRARLIYLHIQFNILYLTYIHINCIYYINLSWNVRNLFQTTV